MAGYARKSLTRNQRRRKVVVQKLMGIALIAICALMFWLASTGVTPEEKDCTAVFSKLFSQYCRQEINRGHCEPDCCDFCPVNSAYDEIFNRFTDDEEDSNDDDE